MARKSDRLENLRARVARFASARDWQQFHNPKNLAMALAAEAGEILDHFRWLTAEQSAALTARQRAAVALECADVLLFLLRLCDELGVDLAAAAGRKLAINARRYPVRKSRGKAVKYDRL